MNDMNAKTLLDSGADQARARLGPQAAPAVPGMPRPKHYIVLKDATGNERVEYLGLQYDPPTRAIGRVKLASLDSFLVALAKHSGAGTEVYGSAKQDEPGPPGQLSGAITAIIDDFQPSGNHGWRDFRLEYKLEHSRQWVTWLDNNGRDGGGFASGEDFALFLEQNQRDIASPTAAEIMEVVLNFHATETTVFQSSKRLEDGRVNFQYKVEGSDEIKNTKVPSEFRLQLPVFAGPGHPLVELVAKLRYRASGGNLTLWYELIQPGPAADAAFLAMLERIEQQQGRKVLYGAPE